MSSSVPTTGPIRIDCRGASGPVAIRRIEAVLKRVRRGARTVFVRTDSEDVLDLVLRWCDQGSAHYEVTVDPGAAANAASILAIYLLPLEFDGHPLLGWRPALHRAADPDLVTVG